MAPRVFRVAVDGSSSASARRAAGILPALRVRVGAAFALVGEFCARPTQRSGRLNRAACASGRGRGLSFAGVEQPRERRCNIIGRHAAGASAPPEPVGALYAIGAGADRFAVFGVRGAARLVAGAAASRRVERAPSSRRARQYARPGVLCGEVATVDAAEVKTLRDGERFARNGAAE